MSKAAALAELYAEIPTIECQGKCQESCGPILCSRLERRRVMHAGGRELGFDENVTCTMLDDEGRCRAYAARPLICRLWGVVEAMRCPHGCKPERYLTKPEANDLMRRALEIGGRDRGWEYRTIAASRERLVEMMK